MYGAFRTAVVLLTLGCWLTPAVCACEALHQATAATGSSCCAKPTPCDVHELKPSCCQADSVDGMTPPTAPGDCECAPEVETDAVIPQVVDAETDDFVEAVPPASATATSERREVRDAVLGRRACDLQPTRPVRVRLNVWLC